MNASAQASGSTATTVRLRYTKHALPIPSFCLIIIANFHRNSTSSNSLIFISALTGYRFTPATYYSLSPPANSSFSNVHVSLFCTAGHLVFCWLCRTDCPSSDGLSVRATTKLVHRYRLSTHRRQIFKIH